MRYDDLAVARGSKAWVPFFRVAGEVDPANGDASRRLAEAVEQEVLTQPPYASRDVDVETYFKGAGNLEVIRMIALSDRVFGWDSDYDILFDASLEAIRADPWPYVRGSRRDVLGLPLAALRTRAARAAGADPRPARRARDRREAVPGADHRLAARRGGALRARLVPDGRPRAMRRARPRGGARRTRRGAALHELIDTVRDWNAQLPVRDSNAWLASKGGTASDRWPRSILWIAVAAVALAVRRPRGSAPILVLMGVGALVLGVHALSQAPQSEFALPFVPVWIVAALVGLLAPAARSEGGTRAPSVESLALGSKS